MSNKTKVTKNATKGVYTEPAPLEPVEPTKRLTLEIPESLHATIKSGCAYRRTLMKDEVSALLEANYRPLAS
jgi:hypothetical protein